MKYSSLFANIAIVIFAGGFATRLRGRIDSIPKSMILFNEKPFLSYIVGFLIREQLGNIYILAGHHSEVIDDYFSKPLWNRVIILKFKPEGTGGDLLKALKFIPEKELLILNGDTILDFPIKDALNCHRREGADATMILTRLKDVPNYGAIHVGDDGLVFRSEEGNMVNQGDKEPCIVAWKGSSTGALIINVEALKTYNYVGGKLSLEKQLLPYIIRTRKVLAFDNNIRYFYDFGEPHKLDFIESHCDIIPKIYGEPQTCFPIEETHA